MPTETSAVTQTSTFTPEPITNTPTPEFLLKQPQGTPIEQRQGIPVMPGVIAGEADNDSYSITISESPENVQGFYEQEVPRLGWELLAIGEGETGSILMIFTKGSSVMSINIILQENGIIYVLIVQG